MISAGLNPKTRRFVWTNTRIWLVKSSCYKLALSTGIKTCVSSMKSGLKASGTFLPKLCVRVLIVRMIWPCSWSWSAEHYIRRVRCLFIAQLNNSTRNSSAIFSALATIPSTEYKSCNSEKPRVSDVLWVSQLSIIAIACWEIASAWLANTSSVWNFWINRKNWLSD